MKKIKVASLGDRMKKYEFISRNFIIPRSYAIIRIDGKAFHTYTRGLEKPFDDKLIMDMNETAKYLCMNISGAKLAYVQSDEISILVTDFDDLNTQMWFNGNIQKITSISASLATAKFNQLRPNKIALFDSRVFNIPYRTEVLNYFIFRQQDAERNSIQAMGQSLFSHSQLMKKNMNQIQEMCFQKGINWNNYDEGKKRGRLIVKVDRDWQVIETPIFSRNNEYILNLIPDNSL